MNRKLTHDEFLEKVKDVKNQDIIIVSKYVDSSVRIDCQCNRCGHKYKTFPCVIISGRGCQKCVNKERGKQSRMSHQEFIEKLSHINTNIEIIDSYTKTNVKIRYKCKICNAIRSATPNNLLRGQSCAICCGNVTKSHDDFLNEFKSKSKHYNKITIIDNYKGSNKKIKCKCSQCNNDFYITPSKLLVGQGCSFCNGKNKKNQEEFIRDVKNIHNDIEVIGEYIGDVYKIEFKCLKCEHNWLAKPTNVLRGTGCPICKMSKLERRVAKILSDNNVKYVQEKRFEDCKNIRPLPFDFYLEDFNLVVECDGRQHYQPERFGSIDKDIAIANFKELKERDKIKEEYCMNNGINIIRIPYWKIKNIDKILIINSIISGV